MPGAPLVEPLLAALHRRRALLAQPEQDAVRLLNGSGDGVPGLAIDRLLDHLVVHADVALLERALATGSAPPRGDALAGAVVASLLAPAVVAASGRPAPRAIWWNPLRRDVRQRSKEELRPDLVHGERDDASPAEPELVVREGTLRFVVRPREGYSHGLFLDQRENRARLGRWLRERAARAGAPPELLNTFAYTCSFSVAGAAAGARTTSVDLSARWLEWGRANFAMNGLDAAAHDFTRGDALTYLEIAERKGRRFDALVLDPPTFSSSRQRGTFQVERDFGELAALALRVAAPGALLLASHNQRTLDGVRLADKLRAAARAAGRRIARLEPFAPPPDFPGPPRDNPAARGFWVEVT